MPIGFLEWNCHDALPPVRFDPPDRAIVVLFLKCLPDEWIATIRKTVRTYQITPLNSRNYQYVLEMNSGSLMLVLYLDKSFRIADLFFRPQRFMNCPGYSVIISGVHIQCDSSDHYKIATTGEAREGQNAQHPFIVLSRFLFRKRNRPFLEASAPSLFPIGLRAHIESRQYRESTRKDFVQALRTDFPGSIKLYLTVKVSDRLERIDTSTSVFGLTWVFPWAHHMLSSVSPNCAMTDATFSIMKPYVLEILHLITCNESIPIALAVFPTETVESYQRLYDHVALVLIKNELPQNLLEKLPLVSDEGSALEALVASKNLDWKWCHHHLVKKVGASTMIGDWVSRLLRCCSHEDAILLAANISEEIKLLESQEAKVVSHPKFSFLDMMLSSIAQPFRPSLFLRRWARWERFGCPTTTNAAESTHARLNGHLRGLTNAHFIGRLTVIWKQLKQRFVERNSPERIRNRSWNRYLRRREQSRTQMDPAMLEFYQRLHSFGNGQQPEVLIFPDFPECYEGSSQFSQQFVYDRLPESWISPEQLTTLQEGELISTPDEDGLPDDVDDPIPLRELAGIPPRSEAHDLSLSLTPCSSSSGMVNPSHNAAGWDIISSVHRLARDSKGWTTQTWKNAIAQVFTIGRDYLPNPESPLCPEAEAQWRVRALRELGIEL
jgi:hypothetical protein